MKDILNKKRKLGEFEIVALTEKYSIIIQKKLLEKLEYLNSLTISLII